MVFGYPHFLEGKLINVATIENGKGKTMADKIMEELKDAGLFNKKFGAIVFDTTPSNTRNLKGAATSWALNYFG